MNKANRNHPWPRKGDRVYDYSRFNAEEYPDGVVAYIERDWSCPENSQVVVKFQQPLSIRRSPGQYLLEINGTLLWDARKPDFKAESYHYVWSGEEYSWGGETALVTYWSSDFEGNWSSHAGGSGSWELP